MVLTVAEFLAILLLLAGSPGSAFAFGLMGVPVWLARHFYDATTGREHDD